eukprot:TRINITY_DN6982_c0_g1_i4.p1 TRINITY_DN6982_c0_g1~~TRINITY_DN6982_c0_g1_i4.p1  ORF type:complete len:776 (-),score=185.63 TRINITY_DN6982_c0_g1_i4:8-2335(-)
MKFGKYLEEHLVPEWDSQYVDYKAWRKQIKILIESKSTSAEAAAALTELFEKELQKINTFFFAQENVIIHRFADLRSKLEEVQESPEDEGDKHDLFSLFETGFTLTRPTLSALSPRPLLEAIKGATETVADGVFEGLHAVADGVRELTQGKGDQTPGIETMLGAAITPALMLSSGATGAIDVFGPPKGTPSAQNPFGNLPVHDWTPLQLDSEKRLNAWHRLFSQRVETGSAGVELEELPPSSKPKRALTEKEAKLFRVSFGELYVLLDMLRNYRLLNQMAFAKILKKADKYLGTSLSGALMPLVERASFFSSSVLVEITSETEEIYASVLEAGDRSMARSKLRVEQDTDPHLWSTFFLGLYLGIFLTAIFIVVVASGEGLVVDPEWQSIFRMYRGFMIPIVFFFLLGLDVFVWLKYKINYILIFEMDPRDHLAIQEFLSISGLLSLLWISSVLAYSFAPNIHFIPRYYNPVALFFCFLVIILMPFDIFYRTSRTWAFRTMMRVFAAPFVAVHFHDLWLGDQFNSMVTFFLDMEFFVCYYTANDSSVCGTVRYGIRPIIATLPPLWRLLQCLRRYRDQNRNRVHLLNAFKYASVIFVVIWSSLSSANHEAGKEGWSSYDTMWAISAVFASSFAFWWDVRKDWGLGEKNSPHFLLRNELRYPPWVYYVAVAFNLILRFLWIVTMSPSQQQLSRALGNPQAWVTIAAFLELFRRTIWNLIRLENEHLNNCDSFRAVREIPLPLDTSSRQKTPTDGKFVALVEQRLGSLLRRNVPKKHT